MASRILEFGKLEEYLENWNGGSSIRILLENCWTIKKPSEEGGYWRVFKLSICLWESCGSSCDVVLFVLYLLFVLFTVLVVCIFSCGYFLP